MTAPTQPAPSPAGPATPPARTPAPGGAPSDDVAALPTLVGALAVLAGSAALPSAVAGSSWLWPLVEVLGVIWLVGVGCRLIRLPPVVTVLVQLAALIVALTGLFTYTGIGGVLPDASVLAEARDLWSGAWEQIVGSIAPAPATPELTFLICASVGLAGLIVDILVAPARTPALVALPLLCLYSVPASIADDLLPWPAFVLPVLAYVLLLAVCGYSGRGSGWRPAAGLVSVGVPIAVLAAVIALFAANATTSVGTQGRIPRSNGTNGAGIGLSPFASLQGDLQRSQPVDLLRVSGLDEPEYLRTIGLEQWTPGEGWSAGPLSDGSLPETGIPQQTELSVQNLSFRDRFLPVYAGMTSVTGLDPGWSYDQELGAVHRDDLSEPPSYRMTAVLSRAGADQLRTDTVTPDARLVDAGGVPDLVAQETARITAGAPTAFDKAQALQQYFTDPANGFVYSLSVPTGNSGDALVDFLQLKQGYCEQYASAMAVMARAAGLPARVAVGFTQGDRQADGSWLITSHDAHAWVEVRFDGAGWVRFDPTPLGGGQGGQQGFQDAAPTTSAAPSATSAAPSVSGQAPDGGQDEDIPTGGAAAPTTAGQAASPGSGVDIPSGAWWSLLTIAVLGLLVAGPTVLRSFRRRRHLTVAALGGPDGATAAWAEIEDLAIDHGLGPRPAESARATANRLAKSARLGAAARDHLRTVVVAVEHGWYSADPGAGPAAAGAVIRPGRTAPGGDPVVGSPDDGGGGVAVLDAPGSRPAAGTPVTSTDGQPGAELVDAVAAVGAGLSEGAPLSVLDRLVPRSVRPRGLRD
ncbi:transglutaminase domain-containing protein [Nakamurella flavida]|uniref:Transglutaminase domain-containing protein n=1 Tax=Nakamurella flavida TaxID=363630 RepID=A0A938YPJ5_9ACTN|nr:DUF3488 and transglutaminase-like domain-containing protein [Nakamurella flavida]MBM9478346.1 transglutaminase domain-containing protein [Nakamurella flavida]MDP9777482.1 transglutaminase-like putative cysteine protease [Nakamurella flavida]